MDYDAFWYSVYNKFVGRVCFASKWSNITLLYMTFKYSYTNFLKPEST